MATTPIAYNPSQSPIDGTEQLGDLAIGTTEQDYSSSPGGVTWWMGPEDSVGYVIAVPVSGNTQPTEIPGVFASVGFFQSVDSTENSFVELTNSVFGQNFTTGTECKTWLNDNGYWTSFVPAPVTPTPTPTVTPTRTLTPTPTPTVTPSNTPYPPNTYFFYLPDGVAPTAPTKNGELMFTTNGLSEVGYNPNTADEVVIYLTDKSGTSHPNYPDVVTYGGVLTMTQGSNTAILSGDTGLWGSYPGYISGNYLEVVQSSPNPFVSGSPINLVLTVNYPPTPTPTPTPTSTQAAGLLINLDSGNLTSYPGTGSTWYDLAGTANNATLFNSPTYSSSYGGILQFDDVSSEYGTIPNIGSLSNWTVEVWFRLTTSLVGKVTSIVSNQFNNSVLNFSIGTNNMPTNSNLAVGFYNSGGGLWKSTTGVVPVVGNWYQVVGTYDGTTVRQYVNGVASGGTVTTSMVSQSGGEIRLMRRWDETVISSNLTDGDLAIVKIYNTVLSSSDILQSYNDTYTRFLEPTPTPTTTSTPTLTPTPTSTEPFFLLFEDSSIATAENNDNIEIDVI